ncbi:hypothetical protein F0562_028327 [Nyssa sinensis]|uniref:Uncharacterized protein n=1 Tax=Nyssa sinensis TaxID=561372 RepID=A0A5J5B9S0_9ASTE|nr:hypothetical protein F0562_028327 [Nyssa sinensis]
MMLLIGMGSWPARYIKSYNSIRISDLDTSAIREFKRVFRDFTKVAINISWLERRFNTRKAFFSASFNRVKEISERCKELSAEVQGMHAQFSELEQNLALKRGAIGRSRRRKKRKIDEGM